ncbi:MAG: ABC transporter ATP-binding protein [Anaerolineae bacterium]|nr:ABC transporter ATP-binding protein [Anaerolineae bacterium]
MEASGLTRVYGGPNGRHSAVRAVDGISFAVATGEVFGFLGPNGAGKTTTIRMLTGLLRPTSGWARVAGHDAVSDRVRLKAAVGVVPERSNLYDELTGRDNLIFMAQLYGLPRSRWRPRAEELLQEFGLEEAAGRRFASYSRGMRRRLAIAAALVHRPQVLFLDEPTTGLDVMAARGLRQTIRRLNEGGTTVFLTTHLIHEAQELCHRVAILVQGQIRALDTPEALRRLAGQQPSLKVTFAGPADGVLEKLRRHPGVRLIEGGTAEVRISSPEPARAVIVLGEALAGEPVQVEDVHLEVPSLEDAFVHITGLDLTTMLQEKGSRRNQ